MSSGKRRPFCLGLNVLTRPESDYVGYICIVRLACVLNTQNTPDSKVHGANMGPTWGRQDPGGPHVGPMNFAIWDVVTLEFETVFDSAGKGVDLLWFLCDEDSWIFVKLGKKEKKNWKIYCTYGNERICLIFVTNFRIQFLFLPFLITYNMHVLTSSLSITDLSV